jgi:transcriptional regulator with XRE-family HTH domain
MNRLLYVARKAKGFSLVQMAKVLKITEDDYKALEHSVTDLTAGQGFVLAKLFDIDTEMFLYNDGKDKRMLQYAMEELTKIVRDAGSVQSPDAYFRVVTLGNTALTMCVELNHALYKQHELELDNKALREINNNLHTQLSTQTQISG